MRMPTGHVARRRSAFVVLGVVAVLVARSQRSGRRPRSRRSCPRVSRRATSRPRPSCARPTCPTRASHPRSSSTAGRTARPLTQLDRTAISARATALAPLGVGGQASPPTYSPDGTVAVVAVPVDTAADGSAVTGHGDLDPDDGGRGPPRRAARPGHRRAGVHRRPHRGLRGRRHHAARRDRGRRRDAAAHHLPQPVAVARAARGRGRRGAGHDQAGRR